MDNESNFPAGYFSKSRAIDLGSGTGLVGIVMALLGFREVVLTDMPEYESLMHQNVQKNAQELTRRLVRRNLEIAAAGDRAANNTSLLALSDQIRVGSLFWGNSQDAAKFNPPFDYMYAGVLLFP